MAAVCIAIVCSGFASAWALRQLRLVGTALHFQPMPLVRALGPGAGPADARRFERAMGTERDTWESELVRQIVRARSSEQAQAEANAALVDVDGRLMPAMKVYAACARIAVFGCLIGAALLFMNGEGLSVSVVDVFAIGAAGVLISLAAGKQAQQLVRRKRKEVDEWVDALVRSAWPNQE